MAFIAFIAFDFMAFIAFVAFIAFDFMAFMDFIAFTFMALIPIGNGRPTEYAKQDLGGQTAN